MTRLKVRWCEEGRGNEETRHPPLVERFGDIRESCSAVPVGCRLRLNAAVTDGRPQPTLPVQRHGYAASLRLRVRCRERVTEASTKNAINDSRFQAQLRSHTFLIRGRSAEHWHLAGEGLPSIRIQSLPDPMVRPSSSACPPAIPRDTSRSTPPCADAATRQIHCARSG